MLEHCLRHNKLRYDFIFCGRLCCACVSVCVHVRVSVCALTWLLGRQSQLRVQVRAVVGVYPAFVFLPPAADPVQTNTWEVKAKESASIHSQSAARQNSSWIIFSKKKKSWGNLVLKGVKEEVRGSVSQLRVRRRQPAGLRDPPD